MFSRQTVIITYLPLQEATSPLFSIKRLHWLIFFQVQVAQSLFAGSKICGHWSSRASGNCIIRQFAILRLVRASASSILCDIKPLDLHKIFSPGS